MVYARSLSFEKGIEEGSGVAHVDINTAVPVLKTFRNSRFLYGVR